MRNWVWIAVAVVVTAGAAPAVEPTVTARVKSVTDLTGYFEYLAGIGGQAEAGKQAAGFVQALTDPNKGIEGIDPARPIGAYAVLTPDVIGSYAVVVVPVADPDAVLALIKDKLNLDPKKAEGDVYEVAVPNVPVPVFFTFAEKSLYVTARAETVGTALAAKNRVAPKALFAGADASVAAVTVHLDRVPKDVREMVVSQFEMSIANQKRQRDEGATDAQHALKGVALDTAVDTVAGLFSDGHTLSARLVINPKADDLSAEVALTGKPGTGLAKALAAAGSAKGVASAVTAKGAAMAGGVRFTVPPALHAKLVPVIDDVLAEALDKAKADEKGLAKLVLDALAPSLKSPEVDLGAAIVGVNGGKTNIVAATRVVKGGGIEAALKQAVAKSPKKDVVFAFDQGTTNGIGLHKFTDQDGKLAEMFGTDHAWIGTSDSLLVLGFEPDAALTKAIAAVKPTPVPLAFVELSLARILGATEKGLTPEQIGAVSEEVFPGGPEPGADTFRAALTGGDALDLRVTLKGKALRFAMRIDEAKKAK